MSNRYAPTSAGDHERPRALAGRHAALANSDEMNRRREAWRLTNPLEKRTIPYQTEDK